METIRPNSIAQSLKLYNYIDNKAQKAAKPTAKEDENFIPVSGQLEPLCENELSDNAVGNGGWTNKAEAQQTGAPVSNSRCVMKDKTGLIIRISSLPEKSAILFTKLQRLELILLHNAFICKLFNNEVLVLQRKYEVCLARHTLRVSVKKQYPSVPCIPIDQGDRHLEASAMEIEEPGPPGGSHVSPVCYDMKDRMRKSRGSCVQHPTYSYGASCEAAESGREGGRRNREWGHPEQGLTVKNTQGLGPRCNKELPHPRHLVSQVQVS